MERIICMAIGCLLLLGAGVFAARERNDIIIISCGAAQTASEHNSWPKDDNRGNGCMHQTVSAIRHKRAGMHGC